ncbi:MAG: hypothetical protein M3Y34_07240 [Actinomycetota bacterium]|nr:hypothetical protein [Actinomycetota bacterium]
MRGRFTKLAGLTVVIALASLLLAASTGEAGGGIALTMTVQVDRTPDDEGDQVCEPFKDRIKVKKKKPLDICYEVANTSGVSLTRHDLTDSERGVILDDFTYTLSHGASAFIIESVKARKATYRGHWVAANSSRIEQATDRVEVEIK